MNDTLNHTARAVAGALTLEPLREFQAHLGQVSRSARRQTDALKTELTQQQQLRQQSAQADIQAVRQQYDSIAQLTGQAAAEAQASRQRRLQAEMRQLHNHYDARLAQVAGNAQAEAQVERERAAAIQRTRQESARGTMALAVFEKTVASTRAIIDGLAAVNKALANPPGPPFSIPQAVAAGAFAAVQVAKILAAPVPTPGFARGVIGLEGPGTETSDSIPARLSRGESVMTAEETRRFRPTLEAIRLGRLMPDVANALAQTHSTQNATTRPDFGPLVDAIAQLPRTEVNFSNAGLSAWVRSETRRTHYLNRRYGRG
jgi:hypothetical protein